MVCPAMETLAHVQRTGGEVAELEQAQHVRQMEQAIQAADKHREILRAHDDSELKPHIPEVRSIQYRSTNAVQTY